MPAYHQYSPRLLHHTGLIRWLFWFNSLTQLRKWYVRQHYLKLLDALPADALVADFGFGEGQHLFPMAARYPHLQFVGVDRLSANIDFAKRFLAQHRLSNCAVVQADVTTVLLPKPADVLLCVGVMQYVQQDDVAFANMQKLLAPGGLLLLYQPVNGRMLLPFYNKVLNRLPHYEVTQQRQRVYTTRFLAQKLKAAGLVEKYSINTYGWCGTLAHELCHTAMLFISHFAWPVKLLAAVAFVLVYPLLLLLMLLDFMLPIKVGNGILVVAGTKT